MTPIHTVGHVAGFNFGAPWLHRFLKDLAQIIEEEPMSLVM